MGPIPPPDKLPLAVKIPSGLSPERTLFMEGVVELDATWFEITLQCGSSFADEDDIALRLRVNFYDNVTLFKTDSLMDGKWISNYINEKEKDGKSFDTKNKLPNIQIRSNTEMDEKEISNLEPQKLEDITASEQPSTSRDLPKTVEHKDEKKKTSDYKLEVLQFSNDEYQPKAESIKENTSDHQIKVLQFENKQKQPNNKDLSPEIESVRIDNTKNKQSSSKEVRRVSKDLIETILSDSKYQKSEIEPSVSEIGTENQSDIKRNNETPVVETSKENIASELSKDKDGSKKDFGEKQKVAAHAQTSDFVLKPENITQTNDSSSESLEKHNKLKRNISKTNLKIDSKIIKEIETEKVILPNSSQKTTDVARNNESLLDLRKALNESRRISSEISTTPNQPDTNQKTTDPTRNKETPLELRQALNESRRNSSERSTTPIQPNTSIEPTDFTRDNEGPLDLKQVLNKSRRNSSEIPTAPRNSQQYSRIKYLLKSETGATQETQRRLDKTAAMLQNYFNKRQNEFPTKVDVTADKSYDNRKDSFDPFDVLDLERGQEFRIALECLENGYLVALNEELFCAYPHYVDYHLVKYIVINGNIHLNELVVEGGLGRERAMVMDLYEVVNWSKDVVALTDENFKNLVLDSIEMWMVDAYAGWCPACQKLQPQWEQAATLLQGRVKLGASDCDRNEQLTEDLHVKYCPTIFYFNQGPKTFNSARIYQGLREAPCFVKFVNYILSGGTALPNCLRPHKPLPTTLLKRTTKLHPRNYKELDFSLNPDVWHSGYCGETSRRFVASPSSILLTTISNSTSAILERGSRCDLL